MLSQTIYTCEPGQKDALIKRRIEWFDAGRSRGFILLETDDPKAAIISTLLWNDLKEIIPLVEASAEFPDEKGKG